MGIATAAHCIIQKLLIARAQIVTIGDRRIKNGETSDKATEAKMLF